MGVIFKAQSPINSLNSFKPLILSKSSSVLASSISNLIAFFKNSIDFSFDKINRKEFEEKQLDLDYFLNL